MNKYLRYSTVTFIGKFLKLMVEENVICSAEYDYIISNLKHLEAKNELIPETLPKLLTINEAAAMLNIGLSNFKKLEKENRFPFKRKMVGSSVRYRNTDLIRYILVNEDSSSSANARPVHQAEKIKA